MTVLPLISAGTSFASARYKSLVDKWKFTPFFEFAIAIPSYPILTSVISLIPFLTQLETPYDVTSYALQKAKDTGSITILNPAPASKISENDFKNIDYSL